jgi:hypothetical protein
MPSVAIPAASFCSNPAQCPQRFIKDEGVEKGRIDQGGIIVDNIQKSILAVLGVAAFLTLVIPTGDDAVVKPPKPAEQAPSPPPPAPASQPQNDVDPDGEYASQEENAAEPDEYANFGQPMMDASPVDNGPLGQGEFASGSEGRSSERPSVGRDVPSQGAVTATVGPPPT